jgi:hypothetical protein
MLDAISWIRREIGVYSGSSEQGNVEARHRLGLELFREGENMTSLQPGRGS